MWTKNSKSWEVGPSYNGWTPFDGPCPNQHSGVSSSPFLATARCLDVENNPPYAAGQPLGTQRTLSVSQHEDLRFAANIFSPKDHHPSLFGPKQFGPGHWSDVPENPMHPRLAGNHSGIPFGPYSQRHALRMGSAEQMVMNRVFLDQTPQKQFMTPQLDVNSGIFVPNFTCSPSPIPQEVDPSPKSQSAEWAAEYESIERELKGFEHASTGDRTPIGFSSLAPRRLFSSAQRDQVSKSPRYFENRSYASSSLSNKSTLCSPNSFEMESRSPVSSSTPSRGPFRQVIGGQGFGGSFARHIELFGGSGPAYKGDSADERPLGGWNSGAPAPSAIPSPMPPKPKILQPIGLSNVEEIVRDDYKPEDKRLLDNLLVNTLVYMVRSFGPGAIEQGRIGNALSKEEAVRNYIKEKHGSLINFLLGEGSGHFSVTPGLNGCYMVSLKHP